MIYIKGILQIDPEKLQVSNSGDQSDKNAKTIKMILNGNDELFRQIRGMNITAVGQVLNKHALELRENYQVSSIHL